MQALQLSSYQNLERSPEFEFKARAKPIFEPNSFRLQMDPWSDQKITCVSKINNRESDIQRLKVINKAKNGYQPKSPETERSATQVKKHRYYQTNKSVNLQSIHESLLLQTKNLRNSQEINKIGLYFPNYVREDNYVEARQKSELTSKYNESSRLPSQAQLMQKVQLLQQQIFKNSSPTGSFTSRQSKLRNSIQDNQKFNSFLSHYKKKSKRRFSPLRLPQLSFTSRQKDPMQLSNLIDELQEKEKQDIFEMKKMIMQRQKLQAFKKQKQLQMEQSLQEAQELQRKLLNQKQNQQKHKQKKQLEKINFNSPQRKFSALKPNVQVQVLQNQKEDLDAVDKSPLNQMEQTQQAPFNSSLTDQAKISEPFQTPTKSYKTSSVEDLNQAQEDQGQFYIEQDSSEEQSILTKSHNVLNEAMKNEQKESDVAATESVSGHFNGMNRTMPQKMSIGCDFTHSQNKFFSQKTMHKTYDTRFMSQHYMNSTSYDRTEQIKAASLKIKEEGDESDDAKANKKRILLLNNDSQLQIDQSFYDEH